MTAIKSWCGAVPKNIYTKKKKCYCTKASEHKHHKSASGYPMLLWDLFLILWRLHAIKSNLQFISSNFLWGTFQPSIIPSNPNAKQSVSEPKWRREGPVTVPSLATKNVHWWVGGWLPNDPKYYKCFGNVVSSWHVTTADVNMNFLDFGSVCTLDSNCT